jgi:type IV secretory pathway VirD2 relaxase
MIFVKLFLNLIDFSTEDYRVRELIDALKAKVAEQLSYTFTSSERREDVKPDQVFVTVCDTATHVFVPETPAQNPHVFIEINAEHFNDRSSRREAIVQEVLNTAEVALDDVSFTVFLNLGNFVGRTSVS